MNFKKLQILMYKDGARTKSANHVFDRFQPFNLSLKQKY